MTRIPSLVVAFSVSAFAAQPEVVDTGEADQEASQRCAPAIACSAKLAAMENVKVEAGSDGRDGDGQLVHDGQMVVTYELASNVHVVFVSNELVLPGARPVSADGVQPGLKLTLFPETLAFPSTDVSVHLTMPTWNDQQTWDVEAWWYFSKTTGLLRTDFNLMLAVSDLADTQNVQGMGTLTLTADAGRGFGLFGEGWATWGETRSVRPGAGLFAGLSYAATDEILLDVGAELAFHVDQTVVTGFAGFTFIPRGKVHHAPASQLPSSRLPSSALAFLDRS